MKAKDIRALLEGVDDDAVLVQPDGDHGYRETSIAVGTALQETRTKWTEDHGEAVTPEAQFGKRVQVLITE